MLEGGIGLNLPESSAPCISSRLTMARALMSCESIMLKSDILPYLSLSSGCTFRVEIEACGNYELIPNLISELIKILAGQWADGSV